jgi:succinate dehydrogenase / fumarate reductase iron-sulfur subunit
MKITLEIQRFDPERDATPRLQTFEADAEPTDRLLSVLVDIKEHQDPTLGFRKSCAHGVCGSDAMRINGKERLACKTLIRDVLPEDGGPIRVEPLNHLPVERDLLVNQDQFFEKFVSVKPYFINDEPPPDKERRQSPADHKKIDDASNCILCESCYSACPVLDEENPDFVGPAAAVAATRFNNDSRDCGNPHREAIVDSPNGLWACQSHFECTRVCPRGIKITKHINLAKRAMSSEA